MKNAESINQNFVTVAHWYGNLQCPARWKSHTVTLEENRT